MKKEKMVSRDYVFKENANGGLDFVGDFEDYYKNDEDPWGQKGSEDRLKEYYSFSRGNLLGVISSLVAAEKRKFDVLEVGCGLGYVLSYLDSGLEGRANLTGMDISPTAIKKANILFPNLNFIVGDICSSPLLFKKKYDIVAMTHLLWYILEGLPQVFANINNLLKKDGFLIFSNAFLKEQRYGRHIIDGFNGLIRYVCANYFNEYKIIKAEINYTTEFLYYDGVFVLKKTD